MKTIRYAKARIGETLYDNRTGEAWQYVGPACKHTCRVWRKDRGFRIAGTRFLGRKDMRAFKPGDVVTVKLNPALDPEEAVLPAIVERRFAGGAATVVIEKDAHKVWGGCELKIRDQCTLVKQ